MPRIEDYQVKTVFERLMNELIEINGTPPRHDEKVNEALEKLRDDIESAHTVVKLGIQRHKIEHAREVIKLAEEEIEYLEDQQ